MMKAIVQDKYGPPEDVLQLREIEKPDVGNSEVLVRVRAASVHADVWHVVTGWPYVLRLMGAGVLRPKNPVPGTDAAGIVEAVGKDVTRFRPGDEVFGETHLKFQWVNGGAFAEYVSVPQDVLALKPQGVSFEAAASIPTSGFIALFNLQAGGQIQPGQSVLINGAGGGVGTIAVQLAKAYGARVTGVDSTEKMEMVRSLGADHVIDYTREDFTKGGEVYDLILDVASNLSLKAGKGLLTPRGIYVLIGHDHYGTATGRIFGSIPRFLTHLALSPFISRLPTPNFSTPLKGDVMAVLKDLLETGKLTPVIDRTYPLEEAAEAMRYLQGGRACGKIIITP
jgi:NADPH:quinone reductase-like Zn-dependent oxidoreductase